MSARFDRGSRQLIANLFSSNEKVHGASWAAIRRPRDAAATAISPASMFIAIKWPGRPQLQTKGKEAFVALFDVVNREG
eukprot:793479-Pyramimonas_sp.AAC.1